MPTRGEVIDEEALIDYLDVFAQEPLPQDSPLWDMPNVLLSAHTAAASTGYDERVVAIFLENLARFLDGRPACRSPAHHGVGGKRW